MHPRGRGTNTLLCGDYAGPSRSLAEDSPSQNVQESFHGRLRDECLNATWFRTLDDVRCTLATWREEYNCERPQSSLDYHTPQEFRHQFGYADVESQERFPHPHSCGGDEIISTLKQTGNSSDQWVRDRGQVSVKQKSQRYTVRTQRNEVSISNSTQFDGSHMTFGGYRVERDNPCS